MILGSYYVAYDNNLCRPHAGVATGPRLRPAAPLLGDLHAAPAGLALRRVEHDPLAALPPPLPRQREPPPLPRRESELPQDAEARPLQGAQRAAPQGSHNRRLPVRADRALGPRGGPLLPLLRSGYQQGIRKIT